MDQARVVPPERRNVNLVELAGRATITQAGTLEKPQTVVEIAIPRERNPDQFDKFRVPFFGDAGAAALALKDEERPVLVTAYLSTRFDTRSQQRTPSIAGSAIALAPEGMVRRNFVEISGNLGQAPELRGEDGKRHTRFGLGIGKDKFVPIVGFDDVAQNMSVDLGRGYGVRFEGRLTNHSYDRQGVKRWELQVVATKFAVEHVKEPAKVLEGKITSEPSLSANGKTPRYSFWMEPVAGSAPDGRPVLVVAFDRAATALGAAGYKLGQDVTVTGKLSDREYEGKPLTEMRAASVNVRERDTERPAAQEQTSASEREAAAVGFVRREFESLTAAGVAPQEAADRVLLEWRESAGSQPDNAQLVGVVLEVLDDLAEGASLAKPAETRSVDGVAKQSEPSKATVFSIDNAAAIVNDQLETKLGALTTQPPSQRAEALVELSDLHRLASNIDTLRAGGAESFTLGGEGSDVQRIAAAVNEAMNARAAAREHSAPEVELAR